MISRHGLYSIDLRLTYRSYRQKFYKLKKESEAAYKAAGDGTTAPSTPAVKKTRAPKSTGTGKGKGKRNKATTDDDEDNAEADDTPAKKPRVKKEAAKEKVKPEPVEEDTEVTSDHAEEEEKAGDDDEVVD